MQRGDQLYLTLFSNGAQSVYPNNTLAAFTIPLAQQIDLGSNDVWEVGIAEFTYPPILEGTYTHGVTVIGDDNILIYCDLISPQFVSCNLVRCLRTFICPSAYCQHVFTNIYYVPVEKRQFRDIRIELLTLKGKRFALKNSDKPVKVVLHFRRVRNN